MSPPAHRSLPWLAALALIVLACAPDGAAPDASGATTAPDLREATGPEGDDLDLEALRQLEALGYAGSEEELDGRPVGLLQLDADRAQPGLNLYVSGHAAEATLMDLEARVLHRWALAFQACFPDAPPDPAAESRGRHHWRRVLPVGRGHLIAIFEGQGLVRVDRDSKLVWASELRAHHALTLAPSGELWVLSRKLHTAPYRGERRALAEDFVSVVDPETGALLRETSVLRALMRSDFRWIAEASPKVEDDVFHTNALELLDGRFEGRQPAFAAGHVLLSSRVLNALFVLDPAFDGPEREARVLWAQLGSWRAQHDPRLLDTGRILLFDNSGAEPHSRVLELTLTEPGTRAEEHVVYAGSPERRFYTKFCGAAQRLENGNTLITESGPGRAFEVAPDGTIVWEFVNPAEDEGHIASIFELIRLPTNALAELVGR